MQLTRNSDSIVKGDVMASEQNVTRLTKRLKTLLLPTWPSATDNKLLFGRA